MKCRSCGHQNAKDLVECAKCGEVLLDLGETAADVRPQISKTAKAPIEAPTELMERGGDSSSGAQEDGATEFVSPEEARSASSSGSRSSSSGSSSGFGSGGGTVELAPSTIFGDRYEILELVGEGGMGQVYKVRDRALDKVIALKTIRGEKGSDPEIVQRFKQELLLARKITHKNVVRIHDLGEAEGIKYFTMEYIEGESLKQLIRRRGRIPWNEALPIVRQTLSALAEAHDQGVVHRDLKPQNIMIDGHGAAYIMDFGIARSSETTGMTATGVMIGTPDYMSPEQVRGDKAGPESDLFSFGVILYEMLTGELPYKAETAISKVMMRLTHKPRAPRQITLDIPKYLENVILKCMEVDTGLRYQSAKEIIEDLDREQVDRSLTLRVQKAVGRRRALMAVAAVAVLAVAAGYFFRGNDVGTPAETAVAGPVTTLAILPFTNATGSEDLEWMRAGIPEMLVTDISQSQFVRPVPGERVLKVMRELGIAEHTRFDESALQSLAERAPADSVLYGQYVDAGGQIRLDLTLRKAGSGVPIPLQIEHASEEIFALVDDITGRVKEHLDLTPEQLRGDTDRPVVDVSTASLDALKAYQGGLSELQQGANQAAIPLLTEATKLDAGFAMAYAKLAEAYLNAGEYFEAGAAIERAQSLASETELPLAERYQIHAMRAMVKDDYETAVASYTDLAELYPRDPDIQLNLARSNEYLGDLPAAEQAYLRTLELAPHYTDALLDLAWVKIMSGGSKDAIPLLEEGLRDGRFRADDFETLGTLHSELGVANREMADLDKAMEHFNLSLDYREKAGDKRGVSATLSNMGDVHDMRGDTDKGLQMQKRAAAIAAEIGDKEGESNYQFQIGMNRRLAGDLDGALEGFRASMQIEMEREDYVNLAGRLIEIADVYRFKGQYDDAIVYLDQAMSYIEQSGVQRDKGAALNLLGMVRMAQGLYDQALESFLEAVPLLQEIGNDHVLSMNQYSLAELYEARGEYANAHEALQQSLESYTRMQYAHGIAETQAELGILMATLGRFEDAEKLLEEAGHVGHDDAGEHGESAEARLLLGRAELIRLRDGREKAAPEYERANYQANVSGQKEVAVKSRVELGSLYREQGKLDNAQRLLERTRKEAADARLRPLESEALSALAEVYLDQGDAERSRKAALEAVGIAEKFMGRQTLYLAYGSLGQALEELGRNEEALDAHVKAAQTLEWIRGSLSPEHVTSFMARADIQAFVNRTVSALDAGGKSSEASPLKKWARPASSSSS